MRLVIQRVNSAQVSANGKVIGKIGKGLFVLVGFKKGDDKNQVDKLAEKLIKLRIMADENKKMNKTINEANGKFLIVSQFTLYANTKGGNRPSFIESQEPEKALVLYNYFVEKMRYFKAKVETGIFGEYMNIKLDLDGPVTIALET